MDDLLPKGLPRLALNPDPKTAEDFAILWKSSGGTAISCPEGNFRIYLGGTPWHPWNRSAAKSFASKYIEHRNWDEIKTRPMVEEAFQTRMRGLVQDYRNSLKTPSERELLRVAVNKYQRQYYVSPNYLFHIDGTQVLCSSSTGVFLF